MKDMNDSEMAYEEIKRLRAELDEVRAQCAHSGRIMRVNVYTKHVEVCMFFRLWAFLTRQKLVYLKDFDGELTLTVAKKTPFGYVAKRHWPFHVLDVILLEGGKVEHGSYVHEWRRG